jgi:hypothetical protein
MVFPNVNKLSPDICQMQPIAPIVLIDEKPSKQMCNVYLKVLNN